VHEYEILKRRLQAEQEMTEIFRFVQVLELFMKPPQETLDWFRLPIVANHIVSSRLKAAIEAQNITGVRFEPAQGHKFVVNDYSVTPPRVVE